MAHLSAEQKKVIDELIAAGVLVGLDPKLMDDGVLFGCGDCDRSGEYLDWHRELLEGAEKKGRLHLIMANGGPLQLVYFGTDETVKNWLLEQIEGGFKLKGLRRAIFMGHASCGQAGVWQLSIPDTIGLYFEAAELLKGRVPDCEVVVRLHVGYDGDEMKTYHVDHAQWVAWQTATI